MIQNRREFIGVACGAGCLALCASGLRAETPAGEGEKKKHDFEKLTYCCFECREDRCPLLKATLRNDVELKNKEAAKCETRAQATWGAARLPPAARGGWPYSKGTQAAGPAIPRLICWSGATAARARPVRL
jgi:hypothetical protein